MSVRLTVVLISVLSFASGWAALCYEVVWFRRFSHLWGNSSHAAAAVVAGFLLGLALGARLLGPVGDRLSRPLRFYGILEIGVAILAFAIPFELAILNELQSRIHGSAEAGLWSFLLRTAWALLIVGAPASLLGATVPVLVRSISRLGQSTARSASIVYGVNTLGAAVGCYVAGMHLIPSLGIQATNHLAVSVSFLVGIASLAIASVQPRPLAHDIPRRPLCIPHRVRLVAVLFGWASLSIEMLWMRQLSLALGGSTFAFSAMLAVFLLGIGFGSLLYYCWPETSLFRSLSFLVTALVAIIAVTSLLMPHLMYLVGLLMPLRSTAIGNGFVCVLVSLAIQFAPCTLMGALFPRLIATIHADATRSAQAVASVTAWNTLGGLIGAITLAPLALPILGSHGALLLILATYGYSSWLVASITSSLSRKSPIVAVATVIIFGLFASPPDPRLTNSGLFMYGAISFDTLLNSSEILYFEEGAASNVLVTRSGDNVTLRINGKVDASTQADMVMQLGLAYYPLMMLPHSQDVCVLGLGSGCTAGAALLFDDVRVSCIELSPDVVAGVSAFDLVNHKPLESDRIEMIIGDGRAVLSSSTDTYDLILSEPSNPWMSGVANLFTVEFYEIVKTRLNRGGAFAQWLQLYSFSTDEYALVLRTLSSVFQYCVAVRVSDGDTILIASERPIALDADLVQVAQKRVDGIPAVAGDLQRYFGSTEVRELLATHVLLDNNELAEFLHGIDFSATNTDNNGRLEFDAALRLFQGPEDSLRLRRNIYGAIDPSRFATRVETLGCSDEFATELTWSLGLTFERHDLPGHSLRLAEAVESKFAGVGAAIRCLRPDAAEFERDIALVVESRPSLAARLGTTLHDQGRFEHAAEVFRRLTELHPASHSAWLNLALNQVHLQQEAASRYSFEKAMLLDSLNTRSRRAFQMHLLGEEQ